MVELESFLELQQKGFLPSLWLSMLRVMEPVRRLFSHSLFSFLSLPSPILNQPTFCLDPSHSQILLWSLEMFLSIRLNQVNCLLVWLWIQWMEWFMDLLLNQSQIRMWWSKQRMQWVIKPSLSPSQLVFSQQYFTILRMCITHQSTVSSRLVLNVMVIISSILSLMVLFLLVCHSVHLQVWLKDLQSILLRLWYWLWMLRMKWDQFRLWFRFVFVFLCLCSSIRSLHTDWFEESRLQWFPVFREMLLDSVWLQVFFQMVYNWMRWQERFQVFQVP